MTSACRRWTLRLVCCGVILLAGSGTWSQEISGALEEAVDFEKVGDAAVESSFAANRLLVNAQSATQDTEAVQEFQQRAAEVVLLLSALGQAADRHESPEATRKQYHRLAGLVEHLRQVAAAGQIALDRRDVEALIAEFATLEKLYYPENRQVDGSLPAAP